MCSCMVVPTCSNDAEGLLTTNNIKSITCICERKEEDGGNKLLLGAIIMVTFSFHYNGYILFFCVYEKSINFCYASVHMHTRGIRKLFLCVYVCVCACACMRVCVCVHMCEFLGFVTSYLLTFPALYKVLLSIQTIIPIFMSTLWYMKLIS